MERVSLFASCSAICARYSQMLARELEIDILTLEADMDETQIAIERFKKKRDYRRISNIIYIESMGKGFLFI